MAAPTSIVVEVDDDEYSRFEPDHRVITAMVTPEGASLQDEQITVSLVKARRNRDVEVATKTLTLTQDSSTTYDITFDLSRIVDQEEVPKVRRGDYFIRAMSVTDDSVTGESSDFRVSLITVDNLKRSYLHGADLKAYDVLDILEQPKKITGVKVVEVSKGHSQSWYKLSYNYSDDGAGNVVRSLSWCGGPVVTIEAGTRSYILRRGAASEYIRVKISSINSLPTTSIAEELLVDKAPLDSTRIQAIVDKAISWVEDSELGIYVEPTRVVTTPTTGAITYDSGSDIPNLVEADWDEIVDALTFRRPSAGHWLNFRMPYYPVIKFEELYGQVANTRIVDIALEWVEFHERGGFVELVPWNQEAAFNFLGLQWFQAIRGPVPLPNFWNFSAIVGFRDTPPVLIEVISKVAAMDILTIAGQAYRGGYSSQSISRDGISESVSYTASAMYGIYSATINDYKKFIEENIDKLRGAFRGANMAVL